MYVSVQDARMTSGGINIDLFGVLLQGETVLKPTKEARKRPEDARERDGNVDNEEESMKERRNLSYSTLAISAAQSTSH